MLLGELLKHAHDLIDDPHTNIPERLYEDLTGDAYYQLLLKRLFLCNIRIIWIDI